MRRKMSKEINNRLRKLEEKANINCDVGHAFHLMMRGLFADEPELLELESVKQLAKRLDIEDEDGP